MSQSDEALAKPSSPAGGDMREAVAEYGMKALPEDVCLRMEREARNLANLWANGDEPVRHAALALQVRTHVTALSPSTSAAEPVAKDQDYYWNDKAKRDGFPTMIDWIKEYRWRTKVPLKVAKDAYDLDKPMAAQPAPAAVESAQGVKEAAKALDELETLVNEYDRTNSDWYFRRSVIRGLIVSIRASLASEKEG